MSKEIEHAYISLSGLIGAGKSTLARALGEALAMDVYYEPVEDNVYLEDFYRDMKSCAFAMQIWLLNRRFEQQQRIVWSGRGAVQDRTIYEDAVFARMLSRDGVMSERDYATYVELFERMSNMMRRPTVIVHLDVSPEESKRRIDMRARSCEHGISLEYLTKLHTAYEEFVGEISKVVPVIRVDYRDFVETGKIVDAIKQEYDRMRNVRNITFRGKMTECDSVSDGARPLSSCHPADE